MSPAAAAPLPATTGKTAGGENFPVASLLMPIAVRRQVMAFYRFARMADDIADDPVLTAEEKLIRLDGLDAALAGKPGVPEAAAFRAAVADDPVLIGHAAQLLQAFRRDAVSDHCRDWADLMTYCRYSAAPVGRFLLDLHREGAETMAPGDALCAAHQILNHLQDCGIDYRALGRVYIPRDWLLAHGLANDVFAGHRSPPELRAVFDQVLDAVDGLIELALPLPHHIRDMRLRLEAAATIAVAQKLSALLRGKDPLAGPVKLSPAQYLTAFVTGIARGLKRR
ncbi:MAG TPA: squalene/phytoene synthase family protein [Candidatus Omnitrophota bacterium]|nr:squalene/phytoene synthase family protein [Candidatus Omnitrophota bacterium]